MKYNFDSSVAATVTTPKYNAEINLGGAVISLYREKPFTKSQIKHIKKYFGWEAKNL